MLDLATRPLPAETTALPGGPRRHVPLVSIGLAVYNGEPYLRQALDSILAQTFRDFELIISDNASTDGTAAICREYAVRDCRIRYYRNSTNIGGANNENRAFRLSRGKYFRWAAHDDVLAPTLLERCVEILERDPSIVLCHTAAIWIDASGATIGRSYRNHGSAASPVARFRAIALARDPLEETYGLMRSSVLRRTRLQMNYTNSDRTLMSELALYGRFHALPDGLFFKRMHRANRYLDWRTRIAWFEPSRSGSISFPFWSALGDYLRTVHRSGLPLRPRLQCYGVILGPWLLSRSKNLAKDVAVACYMALHTNRWRRQRFAETTNWSA